MIIITMNTGSGLLWVYSCSSLEPRRVRMAWLSVCLPVCLAVCLPSCGDVEDGDGDARKCRWSLVRRREGIALLGLDVLVLVLIQGQGL